MAQRISIKQYVYKCRYKRSVCRYYGCFIVPADRLFIPAFYLLIILLLWLLPTEYQKQNFRYRSYNFLPRPSTHPSSHQNDGMPRLSIQIPHTLFLPVQVITCRSPSTPSQDSPDLPPFLRHTALPSLFRQAFRYLLPGSVP